METSSLNAEGVARRSCRIVDSPIGDGSHYRIAFLGSVYIGVVDFYSLFSNVKCFVR